MPLACWSIRGIMAENEPKDTNPKTQYGLQKPSIGLIPPVALLHEAAAMMNGAQKYGAFNWRGSPVSASTYVHAALRHLLSYWDGEEFDTDPKTGAVVHHLGAARACLGILLDARSLGHLVNDRPLAGDTAGLIRHFTNHGRLP